MDMDLCTRQYIEESSEDDLPQQSRTRHTSQSNQKLYGARGRSLKSQADERHLIKQELTSPGFRRHPPRGLHQLLKFPSNPDLETVDDSDSDSGPSNDDRRVAACADLSHSPLAAAAQDTFHTPAQRPPRPLNTLRKHHVGAKIRKLSSSIAQKPAAEAIEEAEEEVLDSVKKQRHENARYDAHDEGQTPGAALPASAQRAFLASHLTNMTSVPSSARKMTPKKGVGPLCHHLQHLLKQQETLVSSRGDAQVKVLTWDQEGHMMRAHCQLESSSDSAGSLPKTFLLLLKTNPRIEASPGRVLTIRKPWQSMELDGCTILMVRHADLQ